MVLACIFDFAKIMTKRLLFGLVKGVKPWQGGFGPDGSGYPFSEGENFFSRKKSGSVAKLLFAG